MQKILTYIMTYLFLIISLVPFFGICEGQRVEFGGVELEKDFPISGKGTVDNLECDENTNLGDCTSIKEDEEKGGDNTIIRKLLGVFGLNDDKNNAPKFIDYIRAIMNIALGLIAFIALIMAIYTFYMMLFSENEAGIKKAKGNLFGIFIALVIIGLAWLIISFIFRWYQSNWKAHEAEIETGKIEDVGEFYD